METDSLSNTRQMVGMELKKKSDMHWARKIWHMSAVSGIALGCRIFPEVWVGPFLLILWFLFVPLDYIRLRSDAVNDFLMHVFGPLMRQTERNSLAGTSYLLTGVLLTYVVFPNEIFMITLLYLAFADPIASIFGIKFGKDKIFGNKSLQGSLAAFAICTAITFVFLFQTGVSPGRGLVISLLGGLIGALAELVPIASLDDNFSIPVLSATGLWLLFSIFGVFAGVAGN